MARFKIGDRVRRRVPSSIGMQVGEVVIVKDYFNNCDFHASGKTGLFFDGFFELVESAPTPHKWAKEIKAWADGAEIETSINGVHWHAVCKPHWENPHYRIKPEPKPDRVGYMNIVMSTLADKPHEKVSPVGPEGNNVQFTFDGETGKLKAVELIG